ncbi:MAG TPA: TetR/AcrR family transcriptional regulator [Vicinamibacterales bacterium]|jgi:AcrR family transcriptional regulator|nr:TetR/AcrR family transcriptional regulator [Vicinamibacterales bacterium]
MGIRERQERDREAVRRSILDAARELFVNEGYPNVSIRKIAERIEYSPASIYGYFPSKDDIFFALAEEGFRLLHGKVPDPALEPMPPVERIRSTFWCLYQFSIDHPQYFALMFLDRSVPRINREYERFTFVRELKSQLLQQVQACIDEGTFPPSVKPMVAFRVMTAGVMGAALLRLSDRLAPGENGDDLARDVLNVTIAGLQTGVALQATTELCLLDDESDQDTSSTRS